MAKLTRSQAQDIWTELRAQIPKTVSVKKIEMAPKKVKTKVLTQAEKNQALGQALNLRDDVAFEKALKAGANMTYDMGHDYLHLSVLKEGTLKMAELLFENGLTQKNIRHQNLWEAITERNMENDQELIYWKLFFSNGVFPNRDVYRWNLFDFEKNNSLLRWWVCEGVFKYPEQYSRIGTGGFDQVFKSIIRPILEKKSGEFFEEFWEKLKTHHPEIAQEFKKPEKAGSLWVETVSTYREKEKDVVSCLQAFIRQDILPPARKSIPTGVRRGYKKAGSQNKKSLSWPSICIELKNRSAFNFFMKSPKMVELFKEDVHNHPTLFTLSSSRSSFAVEALIEAGLDFKMKDSRGHHIFYDYFDNSKIIISSKMHQFFQDNAEFILESKDRAKKTCLMQTTNNSYALSERKVVLMGKKMEIGEYQILLERVSLARKLKGSEPFSQPSSTRKRL